MRPIVLEFVGGYWDGKSLRNDSSDQEEEFLTAACYEMSHHGAIGAECVGLSEDAVIFARKHGWEAARDTPWCGDHRYLVSERRETEKEIIITFTYHSVRSSDVDALQPGRRRAKQGMAIYSNRTRE